MRILIIHRDLPFPADNGGKLRRAHVLRYLANEHQVVLTSFGDESDLFRLPEKDKFDDVRLIPLPTQPSRWRRGVSSVPSEVLELKSPVMDQHIRETVERFSPHVVLAGEPALAQFLTCYDNCVRVLDYVMVLTLSAERFAAISSGVRRWLWKLRRKRLANYHREIAPLFDMCLVNSIEDRMDLLNHADGWNRVEFIPNGLNLEDYPLELADVERQTLVYPGSVTYPPNRDAVAFFVDQILPRIREAIPNVVFKVTGAVPDDGSQPMAKGVEYTGYVSDVRPVVASANVCVVPLRSGAGGTRFKVLEAMALGTPVVSTQIGAEGVKFANGVNITIANRPEEFADAVVSLMKSTEKRAKASVECRRLIEGAYSWDRIGKRVSKMFNDLYRDKLTSGLETNASKSLF